ncbi:unnamed protein product [Brassicogethes aeneus]|uniref:Uncharacterized protein n=1 Tax=Brassicogethes aeneus TaxID=1431903 RepID=A0A9P0B147_BRAAE|nr:unnamed protein product [Brassicogethes aeneus]
MTILSVQSLLLIRVTMLNFLIGFFVLPLVVLKLWLKIKTKTCLSKTSLVGKTAIVTGANSGIGYETALDFATRGARVILACRDQTRAEHAKQKIIELTSNPNIIVKLIDMSSLESVRNFAEEIKRTEEKLDILVNNAGSAGIKNKLTKDGLQILMQVNYFGPFLLTVLLIDLLKKSAPSRIVNVSSLMAKFAKLDPNDLNKFSGHKAAYQNSKICNILFTKELARRVKEFNISVYSIHPGAVQTNIFKVITTTHWRVLLNFFYNFYFKTAEEGAQTIIHTAIEKNIEHLSGEHFHECAKVSPYKTVGDWRLQEQIFEATEELVKLSQMRE